MNNDKPVKTPLERFSVRLLLGGIALAFLFSMTVDILGLRNGGAMNQITAWTDWLTVLLAAILALLAGRNAKDPTDHLLMVIAFSAVLMGDTFLAVYHSFSAGSGIVAVPFTAVTAFIACHITFILRHGRNTVFQDRMEGGNFTLSLPVPAMVSAILSIPVLLGLGAFLVTVIKMDLLVSVFVIYLIFLFVSFGFGWIAFRGAFFGKIESRFIAAGLSLFLLCDLTVGLNDSGLTRIPEILHILIWIIYTPALTLLALSAWKWDDHPKA